MKVVVLLSQGCHPATLRPRLARDDTRAIRLALSLTDAGQITGLHAGRDRAGILPGYLGHGLRRIERIDVDDDHDPTPHLTERLRRIDADIVLAGIAAETGRGQGVLPYTLAAGLERPILPDIVAVEIDSGTAVVETALPRGQRQRLRAGLPFFATVGPAAPRPGLSTLAGRRAGTIDRVEPQGPVPTPGREGTIRVDKSSPRPKFIEAVDPGLDALARLEAITSMAGGQSRLSRPADATAAAHAFLDALRSAGAIADEPSQPSTGSKPG